MAVVPVGDPKAAAPVTREIRNALDDLSLLSEKALLDRYGSTGEAPPRAAWAQEGKAAAVLKQARDAYYDDRLAEALDLLADITEMQEAAEDVPVNRRVELALWKAAVHLGLKDDTSARVEAERALSLAPTLEVNTRVFPPSVDRLVDEVRKAGLKTATVLLKNLPDGASVQVDSRPVEGERLEIPLGEHVITATAPGYAPVRNVTQVDGDVTVTLDLVPEVRDELAARLAAIVTRGAPDRSGERLLREVASELGASVVVVVLAQRVAGMERRAYAWTRGEGAVSLSYPRTADGERKLVEWVDGEVHRLVEGASVPTAPTEAPSVAYSMAAGPVVMARTRQISGAAGNGFDTRFLGVGPAVTGEAAWGAYLVEGNIDIVSYDISEVEVPLTDGTPATAGGGTSLLFRIAGGARFVTASGLDLRGTVGFRLDQHQAVPISDSRGNLGLLTSYRWLAGDLRAAVRVPVGRARLGAWVGLAPVSSFSESPSGATGEVDEIRLSADWGAQVGWLAAESWEIQGRYAGSRREIVLSGQAEAPVSPPLTDVELGEMFHGFTLSVARTF